MEKVMLKARNTSSRKGGIGMIMTIRIAITAIAIMAELDFIASKKVLPSTTSDAAIFLIQTP